MKHDIMQRLAAARPAGLDPDPAPATGPEPTALLAERYGSPAGAPSGRSRTRPPRSARWGLVATGATVVAAAVGLVLAQTPAGTARNGGTHGADPAEPPRTAAYVLTAAAEKTGAREGGSGAAWRQRTVEGHAVPVIDGRRTVYVMEGRTEFTTMLPGSSGGTPRGISRELGVRPMTEADAVAWREDGSPVRWRVHKPAMCTAASSPDECGIGGPGNVWEARLTPGPVRTYRGSSREIYAIGGENFTLEELRALPTTPDRLAARILDLRDPNAEDRDLDRTGYLFRQGMAVALMPVTDETRAAAYRMLSGLPGVRNLGQVRDPLGRTGTGVALTLPIGGGEMEGRLLIDPATGAALAQMNVLTARNPDADRHPFGVARWIPSGTLIGYTAVTAQG